MKLKLEFFLLFLTLLISLCNDVNAQNQESNDQEIPLQDDSPQKNDEIVDKITKLAQQIMELVEPLTKSAQATTQPDGSDTYVLSFIKKHPRATNPMNRKQASAVRNNQQPQQEQQGPTYDPYRKMTVNNNFSGDRLNPTQVFVERGGGKKQPPAHNIQMMNEGYDNQQN